MLFAAVPALIGTAGQHAEQDPERQRTQEEVTRYHAAVDAYREGGHDSVNEILAWDPKRLTETVGVAYASHDSVRPEDQERVKAAAMLHTDAAIRMLGKDEPRAVFQLELAVRSIQAEPSERIFTWAGC